MKLGTFYVLCHLCTFTWTKEIPQTTRLASSGVSRPSIHTTMNYTREKRALGLILSGLAQVFGYTVEPVQLATLPNRDPNSTDPTSTQTSSNDTRPALELVFLNQNVSSTTVVPRIRETIRVTGVLSFGNGTNILNHLQQYENIFHGGNNTSTPRTVQTSSTTPPNTNRPPVSSIMLNIPLPTVPQSPLPEIPPLDLELSYPKPLVLAFQRQNMTNTRNESTGNVTSQNGVGSKGMNGSNADTPRWKAYEDRLAELERTQQEQAERLRQQELLGNRGQNYGSNDEGNERKPTSGEKQLDHRDKDCREGENGRYEQSEEEDTRETSGEYSQGQKGSLESDEEEGSKNDDVQGYRPYEEVTNENYTDVYSVPLPISEDDEQRRPMELRNSYGELLNNRDLSDEGFVNYFGKYGQQDDFRGQNSTEEDGANGSDDIEDEEGPSKEKTRDEYDPPARNKYEEYTLEGDTDPMRQGEENSEEDVSSSPMNYSNEVSPNGRDSSPFEDEKPIQGFDFSRQLPLIVPVRYLTGPEEAMKYRSGMSMIEDTNEPAPSNTNPAIGFPGRQRKLHDGEQKQLQMWPPPFDFVLDSTIRTNDVAARSVHDKNEPSDLHEKANSFKKRSQEQDRARIGQAPPVDLSSPKPYDYPDNIYSGKFDGNFESGSDTSKQSSIHGSMSAGTVNGSRIQVEEMRLPSQGPYQRREVPDFWQYPKHTSNHAYSNVEGTNMRIKSSEQSLNFDYLYPKRHDSLKRSAEEPMMMYFGGQEGKNDENQRARDSRLIEHDSKSSMAFRHGPSRDYDYFVYGPNGYVSDYASMYEKPSGVFTGDQRIVDKEQLYRYDESLTRLIGEAENKNGKVSAGDQGNVRNNVLIGSRQEEIMTGPISYIAYPRI